MLQPVSQFPTRHEPHGGPFDRLETKDVASFWEPFLGDGLDIFNPYRLEFDLDLAGTGFTSAFDVQYEIDFEHTNGEATDIVFPDILKREIVESSSNSGRRV